MTENGWERIAEHVLCKTFRSGWRGLLDHAWAILLRRPPPYVLERMTFSVWIKTDGRAGPGEITIDGKPPERWLANQAPQPRTENPKPLTTHWVGDVLHVAYSDGTERRYKFHPDAWRRIPGSPATSPAP